jgi:hypothetical protein
MRLLAEALVGLVHRSRSEAARANRRAAEGPEAFDSLSATSGERARFSFKSSFTVARLTLFDAPQPVGFPATAV